MKNVGGRPPRQRNKAVKAMLEDPGLISLNDHVCAAKVGVSATTIVNAKKEIYRRLVLTRFAEGMAQGHVVHVEETVHKDPDGNETGSTSKVRVVVDHRPGEDVQINIHDPVDETE